MTVLNEISLLKAEYSILLSTDSVEVRFIYPALFYRNLYTYNILMTKYFKFISIPDYSIVYQILNSYTI